jgi:hypothetical protein
MRFRLVRTSTAKASTSAKNEGLIVAPIYQGEKEVTAAIKGARKIERTIKVSLE